MTDIEFRFNLADKVDYACRLLRKGVMQGGARLVVTGDAATLDAIDAALWQVVPSDFVAHCRADAPAEVLQRSPVVLALSMSRRRTGFSAQNLGITLSLQRRRQLLFHP